MLNHSSITLRHETPWGVEWKCTRGGAASQAWTSGSFGSTHCRGSHAARPDSAGPASSDGAGSQRPLHPTQGLDLGLLVERQGNRLARRVEVQSQEGPDLGLGVGIRRLRTSSLNWQGHMTIL